MANFPISVVSRCRNPNPTARGKGSAPPPVELAEPLADPRRALFDRDGCLKLPPFAGYLEDQRGWNGAIPHLPFS